MPVQMKNTKTKACRRGNNEGTIYRRKDGRWCGQVTTGYKWDGKPIRKPIYGKTRQDVAKKVAEKVAEVNKAGYVSVAAISNDERIFEAIMNDWFLMIGSANMSANTASNRRGTLKNSVYKKFSKKDIRDITEEMLQKFFNDLVKTAGLRTLLIPLKT